MSQDDARDAAAPVHHDSAHGHGRKFPPEKWDRLLSPKRHAFLDPQRVIDRIGVAAGMHVADLGAGPGFFTLPLAERVGPAGSVDATDISREMLDAIRRRGAPPNVRLVQAEESRIPIADATVDLALLAFVLHELVHPVAFLREVRRILRPGGRLVVLEWIPQDDGMGPPAHERIAEHRSAELLAAGGFRVAERDDANTSQYLLIAGVADSG